MTERSPVPSADTAGPGLAGEAAWAAAAAAVARKLGRLDADAPDAEVWSRLARSTVSGVTIPPLGTGARTADLGTAAAMHSAPGAAPFLRGYRTSGGWDVRARLAVPNPAAARGRIEAALAGGVTSLWIQIGSGGTDPQDLAGVLAAVPATEVPIVLDFSVDEYDADGRVRDLPLAVAALRAAAAAADGALHPDCCIGIDPIGVAARRALAAGTARHAVGDAASPALLGDLTSAADAADLGIRAIVVDGSVVHDAGGDDPQEVGYAMATGAAYMRALTAAGFDVDAACRMIEFRYAVSDDQFASMAKLRAARLTWHRICELSGASADAREGRQHAVTSRAMMTRYDRHVNMLRTTVATFAAGAGGADAVTTLPFDAMVGSEDDFGARMARNVSALLLGESRVGDVADPGGGAYALEMLTAEMAEAAWAELGRIENVGGVVAALADGSLESRIESSRAERTRRIARRRMQITGVSEFPNADEPRPDHAVDSGVRRWAEPFEALRDDPPREPLLLVRVGSPARASGRMLFTENLLAAGGIHTRSADGDGSDAAALARAVAGSGCRTVMFAGSDKDYAESLAALAGAARVGGARAVFLAGRPAAVLEALPDGAIDASVAAGDDVIEFLTSVRATLGESS